MWRSVFATLLLGILASPVAAAPTDPNACTYTLGFADLHNLIPQLVGDCRDNATPQPNGDVQQATQNGLLVWRKADNWTAFTDGASTWINGLCGVQSRPNDRRFFWEVGEDCLCGRSVQQYCASSKQFVLVPPQGAH